MAVGAKADNRVVDEVIAGVEVEIVHEEDKAAPLDNITIQIALYQHLILHGVTERGQLKAIVDEEKSNQT